MSTVEDEKKSCDGHINTAPSSQPPPPKPKPQQEQPAAVANIVTKLARPNILSLHPYRCARDDYSNGILLDANENAYGPPYPPPSENKLVLERYPDPYQIELKTLYAQYRTSTGLPPCLTSANIFAGVGSDEAIDLLMRIFCIPGHDDILITPPTYGMYGVSANVNDVGVVKVSLTPDFDVRIEEVLSASTPQTKLLFLCSPGNPTAKAIPLDDIEVILKRFTHGIVVVDEAYVDFCLPAQSALNLIPRYPSNLVVMQTLSKAFGLAGIRMGFAISGNTQLIQLMNNVKAPYNVNKLTSDIAIKALQPQNVKELSVTINHLLVQRTRIMKELQSLPFVTKVYPSDSNFVLFRLQKNAQRVYKCMADEGGVVTRYRGTEIHCEECIRVTVGTEEENTTFLQQLCLVWDKLDKE